MTTVTYHDGNLATCYRCNRSIMLGDPYLRDLPTTIPRWLPALPGDRMDCPRRNGEHCTPYPPEPY